LRKNFELLNVNNFYLNWLTLLDAGGCIAMLQTDAIETLSQKLAHNITTNVLQNENANTDPLIYLQPVDENKGYAVQLFQFGLHRQKLSSISRDPMLFFQSAQQQQQQSAVVSMQRSIKNSDYNTSSLMEWNLSNNSNNAVSVENNALFQTDVQLITLNNFSKKIRMKLGGLVLARSVKFLGFIF
jgi:hypothetical protein